MTKSKPYKPSKGEINKAEAAMTPEQKKMTTDREKGISLEAIDRKRIRRIAFEIIDDSDSSIWENVDIRHGERTKPLGQIREERKKLCKKWAEEASNQAEKFLTGELDPHELDWMATETVIKYLEEHPDHPMAGRVHEERITSESFRGGYPSTPGHYDWGNPDHWDKDTITRKTLK